jgi:CHASE3 domain sensor protein
LREAGDEYKDYLKSLEQEAIPYLDWKRKQMNLPIPKRRNVPIEEVSK